jgi:DNA-binding transcriptional regulator LsrR (DeoR family)
MLFSRDIVKVAYNYYCLGLNQQQIGDKLNMSRQRVNRLLKKALLEGVVEIRVHGCKETNVELESELESKYGINEAIVVEDGDKGALGSTLVAYLHNIVREGQKIGVAYGSTLAQIHWCASDTKRTRDISVIQLFGGLNADDASYRPDAIVNKMASILGGRAYSTFAPAFVDNPALKQLFNMEHRNKDILKMYARIDIAALTVGALRENSMLIQDSYFKLEDFHALREKGAVGVVGFWFYNIDGEIVDREFNERVMGIPLEEYKKIDLRIGVAYGEQKVRPLIGAINGGFINMVVTDVLTARRLLEQETN